MIQPIKCIVEKYVRKSCFADDTVKGQVSPLSYSYRILFDPLKFLHHLLHTFRCERILTPLDTNHDSVPERSLSFADKSKKFAS